MKKKWLFIVILFAIILAFKGKEGVISVKAETRADWDYRLQKDGSYTIVGYYGREKRIVIPNEIDGKRVTSIGAPQTYNTSWNNATNITIPKGVTNIRDNAFVNCDKLTSITIPDSVTSIGDYAFKECTNLTSITIPNSVTSIGDYAFQGCGDLTSVTISKGVANIGYGAFQECYKLTSIKIPSSVKSIGENAFDESKWLYNEQKKNSLVS